MNKEQQINNILAFLAITFGESHLWHDEIMNFTPDYLIEKFTRYIESTRFEGAWGLHPSLAKQLDRYCEKWKISTPIELIDPLFNVETQYINEG